MHTEPHIDEGRNGQGNRALELDATALEDSGPLAPPQHVRLPLPWLVTGEAWTLGLTPSTPMARPCPAPR